ncbi:MAG: 4-hydroxy-tetrahydrodipicolinate synthase [Acidimicrobiia bacterium]
MDPPFGKVATAMITPFSEDGGVDLEGTRRLVRHLVDNGSDAIVVCGTTGESPTLEDSEKLALIETVLEAVEGRAKVLAGTSTYDTRHSVWLTQKVCNLGIDGILAVTPYYNRPTQAGIKAHFEAIADESTAPVMLYNIPSRTGRRIELATIAELATHPKIVAVKDAVGDLSFTSQTMRTVPMPFWIYSGDDALTLPMLSVGAVGVVSVASHLSGNAIARMIRAFEAGQNSEATQIHLQLFGLFEALFVEPNPIPLKAALEGCGLPAGHPRLPLTPATEPTKRKVAEAMEEASDLLDVRLTRVRT